MGLESSGPEGLMYRGERTGLSLRPGNQEKACRGQEMKRVRTEHYPEFMDGVIVVTVASAVELEHSFARRL